MMISPETYYEEYLQGKSQSIILQQISLLKKEIDRLKEVMESDENSPESMVMPSPLTRIKCNREYLDRAIQAYAEAGGIYKPTKAEQKEQAFNESLQHMKRFIFDYGGYFGGYEKRTYTVTGEKVLFDLEHSLYLKPLFLASFFWKKLQAFLENVASPFWRKLQPHGVAGATPWKQTFFVKSY